MKNHNNHKIKKISGSDNEFRTADLYDYLINWNTIELILI